MYLTIFNLSSRINLFFGLFSSRKDKDRRLVRLNIILECINHNRFKIIAKRTRDFTHAYFLVSRGQTLFAQALIDWNNLQSISAWAKRVWPRETTYFLRHTIDSDIWDIVSISSVLQLWPVCYYNSLGLSWAHPLFSQ